MSLIEWAVDKTTADKLEAELNGVSANNREIEQITWTGGRDWIVISYREVPDAELLNRGATNHGG